MKTKLLHRGKSGNKSHVRSEKGHRVNYRTWEITLDKNGQLQSKLKPKPLALIYYNSNNLRNQNPQINLCACVCETQP